MPAICRKLIGVAVTGALLVVIPSAGFAEPAPTPAERAACTSDAFRMCMAAIPNQPAVIACLKSKRSQLSPTCRQLFDRI